MRLVMCLMMGFLVTGCASPKQTHTPDGKIGYSINCSDGTGIRATETWGTCFEKAGEICGTKGYVVIDKSGDQAASAGGSGFGFFGRQTMQRSMVVQCKE